MAKLTFSKLGLNKFKDLENKQIQFNEQKIEVKQYLPINEKISLVEDVLSLANNGITFRNAIKLELYTNLMIIKYYTNINITDKMLEEAEKNYDLFEKSELFNQIISTIPEEEYNYIINTIEDCSIDLTNYYNSARGILENIINSGVEASEKAKEVQKTINDPNTLGILKDILTKLG